jgi:hypothetical protein
MAVGDIAGDECGREGKPRWAIGDVHAGGADASGTVCGVGRQEAVGFGGTLPLCGTRTPS